MTKDEWLSSGMDHAEAAEAEQDLANAESLLDKAVYSFQQANDHDLAQKARLHRSSIRFKAKLPPVPSQPVNEEFRALEIEAARRVENLLKESLLFEAEDLCTRLLPYLSNHSGERLKREVISKIHH